MNIKMKIKEGTLSVMEMESVTWVQIWDKTICVSLRTNVLEKGMKLSVLPLVIGEQKSIQGSLAMINKLWL